MRIEVSIVRASFRGTNSMTGIEHMCQYMRKVTVESLRRIVQPVVPRHAGCSQ